MTDAAQRGPVMVLAALFLALMLSGCSSSSRKILTHDKEARRTVTLISGNAVPTTPPSTKLRQLSEGQIRRTLRRIIVRVSIVTYFNRSEPKPFLSEQQLDWASKQISDHLSKLQPDQHLELRFRDQFHHYEVAVEIWGEGSRLIYYFTSLAADPKDLVLENIGDRPVNWVTLHEQPGQSISANDLAFILKDQVFSEGPKVILQRQEKLAAIQAALGKNTIDQAESQALAKVIDANTLVTLKELQGYLGKIETLSKALAQNLLSKSEYETRLKHLKDGMYK